MLSNRRSCLFWSAAVGFTSRSSTAPPSRVPSAPAGPLELSHRSIRYERAGQPARHGWTTTAAAWQWMTDKAMLLNGRSLFTPRSQWMFSSEAKPGIDRRYVVQVPTQTHERRKHIVEWDHSISNRTTRRWLYPQERELTKFSEYV